MAYNKSGGKRHQWHGSMATNGSEKKK